MTTGRPSSFTQQIADEICERIAMGESLKTICSEPSLPAISSVFKWLNEKPGFSDSYARARETQADALFDEIQNIADDADEDVQRSRLKVDARKWMAGKLRPKKYGDKTETVLSGSIEMTSKEQRDAVVAAATNAND